MKKEIVRERERVGGGRKKDKSAERKSSLEAGTGLTKVESV